MMSPKVLIADDDEEFLQNLKRTIEGFGYFCDTALNGELAFQMVRDSSFHIVLVNLTLPPLSGNDLISKILKEKEETICIIISDISDPEVVISAMRGHRAFDFLIKPVMGTILQNRIDAAMEVYRLKSKIKSIVSSEDEHFRQILQIFDWKRELQKKQYESLASKIIRQINIGLFHGGGFGGLLSVLSLVLPKLKQNPETKKFEISENHINLLRENYESAKNLVNGFNKAQTILMGNEKITDTLALNEIVPFLDKIKQKLSPMLLLKNQKISVSSLPNSAVKNSILFHRDLMEMAFVELLINAMKYSKELDDIYIILFLREKCFEVKILNPAYENQDGTVGIAASFEQMVFEPFYRLTAVSYDGYYMEEFGAGIGLTIVKKIAELHNADIHVFTIKNFMPDNEGVDVSVSIRFPLLPETIKEPT